MTYRTRNETRRIERLIDQAAPKPIGKIPLGPLEILAEQMRRDAAIRFDLAERRRKREMRALGINPGPAPGPHDAKQKVVRGDIHRTPANRQAALAVAKPPWWAYPPPEPETEEKEEDNMTDDPIPQACEIRQGPGGTQKRVFNGQSVADADNAKASIRAVNGLVKETAMLTAQARDAADAMAILTEKWDLSFTAFHRDAQERVKQLRGYRMTIGEEIHKMMADFGEVRKFFLDNDYKAEVERLKEYVDLMERLQRLKQSGFLDQMTDTMLKLADPPAPVFVTGMTTVPPAPPPAPVVEDAGPYTLD